MLMVPSSHKPQPSPTPLIHCTRRLSLPATGSLRKSTPGSRNTTFNISKKCKLSDLLISITILSLQSCYRYPWFFNICIDWGMSSCQVFFFHWTSAVVQYNLMRQDALEAFFVFLMMKKDFSLTDSMNRSKAVKELVWTWLHRRQYLILFNR